MLYREEGDKEDRADIVNVSCASASARDSVLAETVWCCYIDPRVTHVGRWREAANKTYLLKRPLL